MDNKNTLLREMLSELPTEQLDRYLVQELHKDIVEEETVKHILSILHQREADQPVEITPQIKHAWEDYQRTFVAVSAPQPKHLPQTLIRVASIALALVLLVSMLPANAQAESFWNRLTKWTTEIFEFFDPNAKQTLQPPYVFQAEHEGLQQLYDAVVEIGITEPVIPMWIPEGYELQEYKTNETIECRSVHGRLAYDASEFLIDVRKYNAIVPGQYEKDDTEVSIVEVNGIIHYVMRNKDRWNVAWTRDNLECFLSIDCQETDLYKIIKSIYTSEGKQ